METFLIMFIIFFPMLMACINYFIGKKFNKVRELLAVITSFIEFSVVLYIFICKRFSVEILGVSFKLDGFRATYLLIGSLIWTTTIIFSKEYMRHYEHKDRYYFYNLLTFGTTMGIFCSDDFISLFLFFELMYLFSYSLIVNDGLKTMLTTGLNYLIIALMSFALISIGIMLIVSELKAFKFDDIAALVASGLSKKVYAGGILLLLGFGARASMFPLFTWMPVAAPIAAPVSALLSGILTKTGVYGIIIISCYIFYNTTSFGIILLILAILTMLIGGLLAVFSNNLKKTLACSSMSQIGIIISGIAMVVLLKNENMLAFEGSFFHMINHSLIKLSLFMIAGVVVFNIHNLELNSVKGFGRKKILMMVCFILAAISMMGIPSTSGYISKTLIHESIVEYANLFTGGKYVLIKVVEWLFLFTGGLTIAYMLKLFICLFIEKNNVEELQKKYDDDKKYMSVPSMLVIVISTAILPILGFIPKFTSEKLVAMGASFYRITEEVNFIKYYSFECLSGALISIAIGVLIYTLFVRLVLIKKINGNTIYLDIFKKKGKD